MILEEATFEAFKHWPSDLSSGSNKPILAECELCGKNRVTTKHDYHYLCRSCGLVDNKCALGKKRTKEVREKLSNIHKGETASDETKALMSTAHKGKKNPMFGKRGKLNPNFKGGTKEAFKRYRKTERGRINIRKRLIKRRRCLGYTLLLPLKDGEVGHHVTNKYVIGVPKDVHEEFSGYTRKIHRRLVLEWLKDNDMKKYERVLSVLTKEK